MCYSKLKWRKFNPSEEFLNFAKTLNTRTKLVNYIKKNLVYIADAPGYFGDHWQTPEETWKRGGGDCLEENTTIMTDKGISKIKDLKVGDLVLSYNYKLEQFEYKPVTKIWDKGILDGYNIRLRNGHNITATEEHKFFCRTSQTNASEYEVKQFKDIDLTKWWERQLHCVNKLPAGDIDIDKNWAYIIGMYIAEGWGERKKGKDYNRVRIAQDDPKIRSKIEKALNSFNIPFSKSKRNVHSYYTLLEGSGEYKDTLLSLGTNSFNKKLPDDVLLWNKESLKSLIEGLLDGDGTDCTKYKNNYANGTIPNHLWEYSTSSEEVAKMFNIIVRKVYGNIHYYKQKEHQGAGNQPIWRLRYNPNGLSNCREIYKSLATININIGKTKKVSGKHYYDIEVQDNHNFVLAESGVISHNCEDMSLFNLFITTEIQKGNAKLATYSGYSKSNELSGHAVCITDDGYFSNNDFYKTDKSIIEIGRVFYPALLYMEVVDSNRKVLQIKLPKYILWGAW